MFEQKYLLNFQGRVFMPIKCHFVTWFLIGIFFDLQEGKQKL